MIIKIDINKKFVEFKDFKTQTIIGTGDLSLLGHET